MHLDSPWLGCFLRGSTLHEVISICFVDINLKFIAVVKSDCWTKSIINWVNGLREFYVNFLNGYSQSVSNHPPSLLPSLPKLPPTRHTHTSSSISDSQHESRQLRWDLRVCVCVERSIRAKSLSWDNILVPFYISLNFVEAELQYIISSA